MFHKTEQWGRIFYFSYFLNFVQVFIVLFGVLLVLCGVLQRLWYVNVSFSVALCCTSTQIYPKKNLIFFPEWYDLFYVLHQSCLCFRFEFNTFFTACGFL